VLKHIKIDILKVSSRR